MSTQGMKVRVVTNQGHGKWHDMVCAPLNFNTMDHKEWLYNEYQQWIDALNSCTVDNFQQNDIVRRMLSLDGGFPFDRVSGVNIQKIGRLGLGKWMSAISPAIWRMCHYAQRILQDSPSHICEIGGGVGQFYAILRALGYKGKYYIFDLPEVQRFQGRYLAEVEKRTGLDTIQSFGEFDYCVSFYAYGEFTDEVKKRYLPLIKSCPHGFMIYNPHSGASSEVPFPCAITDEYPLTSPGNKQLVW